MQNSPRHPFQALLSSRHPPNLRGGEESCIPQAAFWERMEPSRCEDFTTTLGCWHRETRQTSRWQSYQRSTINAFSSGNRNAALTRGLGVTEKHSEDTRRQRYQLRARTIIIQPSFHVLPPVPCHSRHQANAHYADLTFICASAAIKKCIWDWTRCCIMLSMHKYLRKQGPGLTPLRFDGTKGKSSHFVVCAFSTRHNGAPVWGCGSCALWCC